MKQADQTPNSNRGFSAQFLCMIPYYNPLALDGVIASIDSLRVKFTYSKTSYDFDKQERFDTLEDLLNELTSTQLFLEGLFDFRVSDSRFRIGNYMWTITYTLPDRNSFAVLVGRFSSNTSVKMVEPEIVMDFNPNKIDPAAWKRIFNILRVGAHKISVQRFDLAMDFPVVRDQLRLERRPGSGYQKFVSKDGSGITEYTGDRSHHAAVKLYDKGADLGIDLVCSRLEVTIDPAKFRGVKSLFPVITTFAPVELTMDFQAFPYEVKSVILHPDLYPILKDSVSRNTWPKYKQQIADYGQTFLTLTDLQIASIDKYVRDYLVNLTVNNYSINF